MTLQSPQVKLYIPEREVGASITLSHADRLRLIAALKQLNHAIYGSGIHIRTFGGNKSPDQIFIENLIEQLTDKRQT